MRKFEYYSPGTVDEACTILLKSGGSARVLAGGTDLLLELRRLSDPLPGAIVDISRIAELYGMSEEAAGLRVGPMETHSRLMSSDLIRRHAPLLASAAATIGSPQIRNRGTLGGNIMNAATCADTVPPLVALGASILLQSSSGRRGIPLADLFSAPYRTRTEADELAVQIRIPKLPPGAGSAFLKLGRRNALSISRLSVAVTLFFDHARRITEARIVPGAAFPRWQRVAGAEEILVGEKPSEELFAAAGRMVSEEMIRETGRRWSTEYKEPVLAALVRRALLQASSGSPVFINGRKEQRSAISPGGLRSADNRVAIAATINGRRRSLRVPPNRTLLQLLREDLGLTGTKCGCEIGECGACTVLIDGKAANSCLVLAPQIDGKEILTVEGLKKNGRLDPLQESFMDHDAAHCGFCTPGMLMSARGLLEETPVPDKREIREAISGNLCRCTGYMQIVSAISQVSQGKKRGNDEHPK